MRARRCFVRPCSRSFVFWYDALWSNLVLIYLVPLFNCCKVSSRISRCRVRTLAEVPAVWRGSLRIRRHSVTEFQDLRVAWTHYICPLLWCVKCPVLVGCMHPTPSFYLKKKKKKRKEKGNLPYFLVILSHLFWRFKPWQTCIEKPTYLYYDCNMCISESKINILVDESNKKYDPRGKFMHLRSIPVPPLYFPCPAKESESN